MVASIAPMAKGSEFYYLKLAREDYYTKGGEPPGKWHGAACERLGLKGDVVGSDLSRILAGYSPEGKKLVRNAGAENRQIGWDMTFSAPKSVSVIWGISSPEQRAAIENAHNMAVELAIDFIQKNSTWSRRGEGGKIWQRAEAAVATFLHGTSRDGDMDLHTHTLFANLGLRLDGTFGTVVSKKFYQIKMLAGALYRCALATGLRQDVGFELVAKKTWFEIKDVPQDVCEHFSKRNQSINAHAGEDASAAEKSKANLLTRSVKRHICREQLYPDWKKEAEEMGFSQKQVDALFDRAAKTKQSQQTSLTNGAIEKSITELAKSKAYFSKEELMRSVLEKLQTGRVSFDKIAEAFGDQIKSPKLKSLGAENKTEYFTTADQKSQEAELLKSAKRLQAMKGHSVGKLRLSLVLSGSLYSNAANAVQNLANKYLPDTMKLDVAPKDYSKLNSEQRAVLKDITLASGNLKVFSGRAGSGKTTLLSAAKESWEAKGLKVVGCALSGMAAKELNDSAGIKSETVAMRLWQLEPSLKRRVRHDMRQLGRALQGKKTYKYEKPLKLDSKTVLVIDEASMISNGDLNKLLKAAAKAKAKVVISGDIRQLPSIEAGGAFDRLFKETNGIELKKSVRQKTPWLRKAANHLAEDEIREAMTEFAHADRLLLSRSNEDAKQKLISCWNTHRTKDLSESVILARTNADVNALNLAAQDIRRNNNELGSVSFTWKKTKYHVGDRIAFHEIDRKLGVWNGDRGTVKMILNPLNSFSVRFVVELDRGTTITFCPRKLKSESAISLGYASTVHKAQGMTVDKTFFLADQGISKELAYVGLTRSRHDTFISTQAKMIDEDVAAQAKAKADLEKKLARSESKKMAIQKEEALRRNQLAHGIS